jgi:hypothetical protein
MSAPDDGVEPQSPSYRRSNRWKARGVRAPSSVRQDSVKIEWRPLPRESLEFSKLLGFDITAPAGLTDTLDFRDETLGAPTEADA